MACHGSSCSESTSSGRLPTPRFAPLRSEQAVRALLVAVGTRGDVQPAFALALELRRLGHAVRMCTSPNFVDWAKSLGLEAVPMGVEMRMPARGAGKAPLTPEELRRLQASLPDLIADQFET